MKQREIKKAVRKAYARTVQKQAGCCGPSASGGTKAVSVKALGKMMGYTKADLDAVPKGANLGLGCGNPVAIASLRRGERVLDLGSGAGFDCFLAAKKVGQSGKIIGVDMTPEMIDQARENAEKGGYRNVEFRLGEIENLPAADRSVDVVISNCVVNLSVDKLKTLMETYRVLRRGGRVSISDLALVKPLPARVRENISAYASCIGGALLVDRYKRLVRAAGFKSVSFKVNRISECIFSEIREKAGRANAKWLKELKSIMNSVVSVNIEAVK